MKKRLAVIGAGIIATHYKNALLNNPLYELVSVCDIDENCKARKTFLGFPFYLDYKTMLKFEKIDTVLILTPPTTHFEISMDILALGYNVLLEKPMSDSFENICKLYDFARKCKKEITCLFHWKYGDEIMFLCDYLKKNNSKIKEVKTVVNDNYCDKDFNFLSGRISLLGTWLDSGVNIISYIDGFLDIEKARLLEEEIIMGTNAPYPVYSRKIFDCDGTKLDLTVDWLRDNRDKYSIITLEDCVLEISHSNQKILKNGECIYSSPVPDRLSSHYENLFSLASFLENNEEITKRIHKITFAEVTDE